MNLSRCRKKQPVSQDTGYARVRRGPAGTLVFLFVCIFLLSGCGILPREEELPQAPVLEEAAMDEYVLTQVFRSDIEVGTNIRCTYIPSEQEKLSFSLGGEKIGHVYVEPGDHVMPGDLLMELDVTDIDNSIRQQQNDLDSLSLQLAHVSESWDLDLEAARLEDSWNQSQGISASSRVSSVNSQYASQQSLLYNAYEVASLRLEELKKQKEKRQIFASIEGNISYLYEFEAGESVVKDRNVVTVTNMENALFEVYSGNGDIIDIGKQYTLVCNDKSYQVTARSSDQLDAGNVKEGMIYFQMEVSDPDLSQGDTGIVRITQAEKKNTLCVVTGAVQDLAGQSVVYILDDQGMRQVQPVTVGISNEKITEILEGLSEGQAVILK